MLKKILAFTPAIFAAITFTILSAVPGDSIPLPPIWNADKFVHLLVYFVQTISILLGFYFLEPGTYRTTSRLAQAVLFSIIMGGMLEILQEHVFINRSGDYLDFLANSLGALLAGLLFKGWPLFEIVPFLKTISNKLST